MFRSTCHYSSQQECCDLNCRIITDNRTVCRNKTDCALMSFCKYPFIMCVTSTLVFLVCASLKGMFLTNCQRATQIKECWLFSLTLSSLGPVARALPHNPEKALTHNGPCSVTTEQTCATKAAALGRTASSLWGSRSVSALVVTSTKTATDCAKCAAVFKGTVWAPSTSSL